MGDQNRNQKFNAKKKSLLSQAQSLSSHLPWSARAEHTLVRWLLTMAILISLFHTSLGIHRRLPLQTLFGRVISGRQHIR